MEAALILLALVFALGFWLGRLSKRRPAPKPAETPEVPSNRYQYVEVISQPHDADAMQMLSRREGYARQHRRPEFRITYHDEDGVITERDIYVQSHGRKSGHMYYFCWCFLRDEQRTFRGDRIMKTVNLDTHREIKDIAAYLER